MKTLGIGIALPVAMLTLAVAETLAPQNSITFQGGSQRTLQFENGEVVEGSCTTERATGHAHASTGASDCRASRWNHESAQWDGSSEIHNWETGKACWLPFSEGLKRHADQNTGSKSIEVMVVELKKER